MQVSRRLVVLAAPFMAFAKPSLRLVASSTSPLVGDVLTVTYTGGKGNITYHRPTAPGWTFVGGAKTWSAVVPPPEGQVVINGSVTQNGQLVGTTINITVRSPGVISLDQSPQDALNLRETITVTQTHNRNNADALGLTDVATVSLETGAMVMLMGCSDSPNEHGDTELWDGWRVYDESAMLALANRTDTGTTRKPKFLAYSKDGPNLGGTVPNYTTVFNEVKADLDSFYYTGGAGSQTHSNRWGIKLYWSNGNENHDKGAITLPHSQAKIDNYIISQSALYDAVHFIDGTTGQRRFPDAFAGSNPTHDAERSGYVQDWLVPSAPWHDFVMWSMYPPGRQTTVSDPTFNWPSFVDADWDNSPQGFMIRCYRATKIAEANAGHPLLIGCGEIGIGNDDEDNTTRPYYIVHGMLESMMILAEQYDLQQPFACYWDNQKKANNTWDATAPQNLLSTGTFNGVLNVCEDPATSPSSREAWQNHLAYNHHRGGTRPASWVGNPKAGWKTTGTAV